MSNLPETMNPDVAHKLLKVGEAFRIPGPFFSYEEIKVGNVNHTYKVNYIRDDGTGSSYALTQWMERTLPPSFAHAFAIWRNAQSWAFRVAILRFEKSRPTSPT